MKRILLLLICILVSSPSNSQINFINQAETLGLGFSTGTTYLGNGVSFCDYNNDGWDDITFATEQGSKLKFFKNLNGSFVEDFFNMPSNNSQQRQINWVDFDNDGDKDLFVTSDNNGNRLYLNDGFLNFQDITVSAGLPTSGMDTYGASWGDYNNDGFLDVFLSSRSENDSEQNYFYKNNGDGTFTDVTSQAGFDNDSHMSFCSAFFDYNNDGWQDLYISSDKYNNQNFLYENNGDGTFTDVSLASGTGISIDAMTTTIGDFNNDGWFDIYITNTQLGNVFFRNNGDGTFTDIAEATNTEFFSIGWGAVFLDAENDMDLDLYVSGSLDGSFGNFLSAAFYENLGNENFNMPENVGFVGDTRLSYSNAIGDIDNDGLADIVVTNLLGDNIFLWENQTTTSNNWLKLKLQGVISNRDGIGSRIEISTNGNKQYRYTLCGEGYLSQNSNSEFFGVGSNTIIDYVKITWLSGQVDYIENVSVNQTLTILEGSNPLSTENYTFSNNIIVYPNPTSDWITLRSNTPILNIDLYNISGKKLQTYNPNTTNFTINLNGFPSGFYFIKIYDGENETIKEIIKN